MVGGQGAAADGESALQQGFGLVGMAGGEVVATQVVQAQRYIRMVGAECGFADGQDTQEQRFGFGVALLGVQQGGEVVQAAGSVGVVGALAGFEQGQRLTKQPFGAGGLALQFVHKPEVVEAECQGVRVVWRASGIPECLAGAGGGLLQAAVLVVVEGLLLPVLPWRAGGCGEGNEQVKDAGLQGTPPSESDSPWHISE